MQKDHVVALLIMFVIGTDADITVIILISHNAYVAKTITSHVNIILINAYESSCVSFHLFLLSWCAFYDGLPY